MREALMMEVMQKMLPYLDNAQLKQLRQTMELTLSRFKVTEVNFELEEEENTDLITLFITAKRIEGCSEKTLKYYKATIEAMVTFIGKDVRRILTEDLRAYLTQYQSKKHSSKVTIDNIRRILSSFFSWLEDEDYIIKSPVRRIHRIMRRLSSCRCFSTALQKRRNG